MVGFGLADFVDDVHAFDNLPEDRVLAVEEVVVDEVDEKLQTAGVGTCVCHREGAPIVPVVGSKLVLDRIAGSALPGAGGVPPCIMNPGITRWKMTPL